MANGRRPRRHRRNRLKPMSSDTAMWLKKPETQLVLGFGTLLMDFLAAKVHEILPQVSIAPVSEEQVSTVLADLHADATAVEFNAFLDGELGRPIDEHQAGRSEVVGEIRHPKKN